MENEVSRARARREAPLHVRQEARQRAREILEGITALMKQEITSICVRNGRQMARLVVAELNKLESEIPTRAVGLED